ncbi:hypothetical protein GRX01_08360 [Halobaculum sp. WSA2]|uniref:DUF8060 domain-containing protein n=1 Tax=Halobaculum saliterrae TaxID=2073113 RepID=A0A6B0SZE7_9EURY|nr:hypothetical protein [Halobaculum saliterrae]MXR41350.1 hypothetical protein [Halobaculum saliterrae]
MTQETDEPDDTPNESSGSEPTASTHDAPATADVAPATASDARADDASISEGAGGRSRDMVRYVNYLVLVALVVLALIAGIQFYGAVSRTINQWVTAEYRSLFHGAFNLAVLLVAAAGISWQVRRVTS